MSIVKIGTMAGTGWEIGMDSIMSNAALKKSLLLYSQFASQHDALAERISNKVGAGAMSVPEFQNFHSEYIRIRKTQLECVSHAGGYVADIMAEQQIRFKNVPDNLDPLNIIVRDIQAKLDQEFPLATKLSVSYVEERLSLVLITNHQLKDAVLARLDTYRLLKGVFSDAQFDPIGSDHQFVCGLDTESGRQAFLKLCQDSYDKAKGIDHGRDETHDPYAPAM